LSLHRFRAARAAFAPIALALLLAGALYVPLLQDGAVYAMNGSFMYAAYPWAGNLAADPRVRGPSFHQTDYSEEYYPTIVENTRALRAGELPLWFPYSLAGMPNLNLALGEFTHPLRLLLYLALPPLLQTQAWLVLSVISGFLGMVVLLRHHGLQPSAAVLGGTVWALNGSVVFWGLFECFTAANATIPWILYLIDQAMGRRQFAVAVIAGGVWGLLFHNGHLQLTFMWSLACALYCAVLLARDVERIDGKWHFDPRSLGLVGTIGLVALAVGAPVWIRTLAWLPDLHRASEADLQLANGIRWPKATAAILGPGIGDFPSGGLNIEVQAFLGIVPLVLVPLGCLFGWRHRSRLASVAAICVVIGAAITFAIKPVILSLRAVVPLFSSLHLHFFAQVAHLGIAILAALGAAFIVRIIDARRPARWMASCVVLALAAAHAIQAIAAFYRTTPSQPFGPAWNFPATPIIDKAAELQGPYRTIQVRAQVPAGLWLKPMLTGRLSGLYALHSAIGYESLLPRWVYQLWRSVERGQITTTPDRGYYAIFEDRRVDPGLLRRLSVGLIMATPEARLRGADETDLVATGQISEVYRGPDGVLYRVSDAQPRAYFVTDADVVDDQAALSALFRGTFDSTRKILVAPEWSDAMARPTPEPIPQTPSSGTVQIIEDGANRLVVRVTSGQAGFLQINDSWSPGWHATIDGTPTPVLRSNFAFRAVPVPAGEHRVSLVYRPRPEIAGIGIEVVALVGVGLFVLVAARRADVSARVQAPA
jgi:hypothetical protein